MVRSVVQGGLKAVDVAHLFNTTPKTVAKWAKRFRVEGAEGLRDRSSTPPFIVEPNPASHVHGLEAKPKERLMPRTLQEQLDQVEREIELYLEFDKAQKGRLNRESYLWTAEDRIEWQEMQSASAQRVRELREERDALRKRLGL
jgi:transposase